MTDVSVKRDRSAPLLSPSGRELRLWLLAVLAGTHAVIWSQLGAPEPELDAVALAAPAHEAAATTGTVWLATLPASERPAFTVAPGYRVVSGEAPAPREVTRVARSRAGRVRTRSS